MLAKLQAQIVNTAPSSSDRSPSHAKFGVSTGIINLGHPSKIRLPICEEKYPSLSHEWLYKGSRKIMWWMSRKNENMNISNLFPIEGHTVIVEWNFSIAKCCLEYFSWHLLKKKPRKYSNYNWLYRSKLEREQ